MYLVHLLALSLLPFQSLAESNPNPKRGLIYIWTENSPSLWTSNTDLTWYYNYGMYPTEYLDLPFVPMLWGVGGQYTDFNATVLDLKSQGHSITHVLGFNEPDVCGRGTGGSCIGASVAARAWKEQIEPLKRHGVKLGAPATSSGGGWWYQEFLGECDGGCTIDFLPIHYYGDAAGLAGYVQSVHDTYGHNTSEVWMTEFAIANATLRDTKSFFNETLAYLDNTTYVDRYSYFGTFRSVDSNVGPNAAMLDRGGHLTDIGAWYLGQNATGYAPLSGAPSAAVLSSWLVGLAAAVVLAMFWLG